MRTSFRESRVGVEMGLELEEVWCESVELFEVDVVQDGVGILLLF